MEKYRCDFCGWEGEESELRYIFKWPADEAVCPKCGAFEECLPIVEPVNEKK